MLKFQNFEIDQGWKLNATHLWWGSNLWMQLEIFCWSFLQGGFPVEEEMHDVWGVGF